jgi:hypothetical protein
MAGIMNTEVFKNEVLSIRARHHCPVDAGREIFELIQSVLRELDGQAVTGEFKRALREELDRAFLGLQSASAD